MTPRAAVREFRMGDADAFAAFVAMVLVTEGDNAMPVLKPDRARGLEARRGEAHELIEEDAAVRVATAFGHELAVHHLCGINIPQAIAAAICACRGLGGFKHRP